MKRFQTFWKPSEEEGTVILCNRQTFLLYRQSVEYSSLPKAAHETPEPQANTDIFLCLRVKGSIFLASLNSSGAVSPGPDVCTCGHSPFPGKASQPEGQAAGIAMSVPPPEFKHSPCSFPTPT